MRYQNISYGADPELFLTDRSGSMRSAIGLIGGTKLQPRPIDEQGSAVQEDNVAVEFNIPPAKTKEEFVNNIDKVMNYLHNYVTQKDLLLCVVPAAYFPMEELLEPRAMEFGCEPDYNVWTKSVNKSPNPEGDLLRLRSAGGHLHISWDNPDTESAEEVVKAMDVFCGAASVVYDSDMLRRELYGNAGAFRFKPYGVEYRTLSNFWLRSPDLVGWVFDQASRAMDFLNTGQRVKKEHSKLIQTCINKGDESALEELQKYYPI